MITQRIINWIKGHEGVSLYPYFDDYAGTPDRIEYSIGYGHQIQPQESWLWNGITRAQAEAMLIKDIKQIQQLIRWRVTRHLNQKQMDALTNLVYSIGIGGASQIIDLLNAHVSKKIIIPIWRNTGIYWQGKKWANLQKGRNTEIDLFYSDEWMAPTLFAAGVISLLAIYQYNKKHKMKGIAA